MLLSLCFCAVSPVSGCLAASVGLRAAAVGTERVPLERCAICRAADRAFPYPIREALGPG